MQHLYMHVEFREVQNLQQANTPISPNFNNYLFFKLLCLFLEVFFYYSSEFLVSLPSFYSWEAVFHRGNNIS